MKLIEEMEPSLLVLRYAVANPQAVLRVTGYVSTSTKEVIDYDLKAITQEDYQELASKSLQKFKQHDYEMPDVADQETTIKALDEIGSSLQAKATNGGDSMNRHERLFADKVGGIYYKDEGQKLVIKQLVIVKKTVTTKAPVNPRARGSKPKTLVKNAILAQLPINDFLGRIDLTPGKFERVEIVT